MNFLHPLFGKHRKRDKGGGGVDSSKTNGSRGQARSEDFKGGGRDFKCCVQENFKKLTLLVAFSDQFL